MSLIVSLMLFVGLLGIFGILFWLIARAVSIVFAGIVVFIAVYLLFYFYVPAPLDPWLGPVQSLARYPIRLIGDVVRSLGFSL